MQTVDILGVPFAKLTQREAEGIIEQFLEENTNHVIVTPNPEGVMQARRKPEFAGALRSADLSLADGTGIVLASYILRRKLPQRVRGVDITLALLKNLSEKERQYSVFLLGGADGVAEKAKENIEKKYSNIKVTGTRHGFFSNEEEEEILDELNRLKPDILLVCLGMPRAEIWAAKNKNINTRATLCVGGTIDILAQTVKMAPRWLRVIGLEWLYRLFKQPKRFKRMLDIPRFMAVVLFKGRSSQLLL